jgi:hypothetical protein
MKIRYFAFISILLILTGCNPNNPQPNPPTPSNNVSVSWQGTIDGVYFGYNGSYENFESTSSEYSNPGKCEGSYLDVSLYKGVVPGNLGENASVYIVFPTNTTLVGSHVINNTNNNGFAIVVGKYAPASTIGFTAHSAYPNTNGVLNITQFPSNIGGLIKGNFNGVIGTDSAFNPNGATKEVTISFEAIRLS